MCGIFGVYYFTKPPDNMRERLEFANNMLLHRGPDGEGYFINENVGLAVRRLSIVDIKGGGQPVYNETKDIVAVFNGEVYGYEQLKLKLQKMGHVFYSQSDTEIIPHLFESKGVDAFSILNGMFGLALFLVAEKKLYLARDYCGIKPLYYRITSDYLIFASEIKAILAYENTRGALDEKSLVDYLCFQFVLDNRTLFKGIKKLKPGHYLVCSREGLSIKQYWSTPLQKLSLSKDQYIENYLYLLKKSLAEHLQGDTNICFHLSGGVDSSALVSLFHKYNMSDCRTFSSGFLNGGIYDDQQEIKLLSENIVRQHEFSYMTESDFFINLPKAIWIMDEPCGDSGLLAQMHVNEKLSKEFKVVISGHGSDETSAGYARHLIFYLSHAIKDSIFDSKYCQLGISDIQFGLGYLSAYNELIEKYFVPGWTKYSPVDMYMRFIARVSAPETLLTDDFLKVLGDYSPIDTLQTEFEKKWLQMDPAQFDVLDLAVLMDFHYMLPPLLQMEDRSSMAYSVESRVPFLDKDLVEFVLAVPSNIKLFNGVPKYLLRESMNHILPDSIRLRQTKIGRPTPLNAWIKNTKYFSLSSLQKSLASRGIVKIGQVNTQMDSINRFDRLGWIIINLELWHQSYVDNFPIN